MPFKYDNSVVLVFARAPQSGRVNTRLIPAIGEKAATQLQHELIHQRLASLTAAGLCHIRLMCTPDTRHPCFQHCRTRYPVSLEPQRGVDLGERMSTGVAQACEHWRNVIVLGTDAPALTPLMIESAISPAANGAASAGTGRRRWLCNDCYAPALSRAV